MDIRRKHRSGCEHVYVIRTSRVLSPDRTWPNRWLSKMHETQSRRVGLGTTVLGLCLELSFNVLYCRTQANPPTLSTMTYM